VHGDIRRADLPTQEPILYNYTSECCRLLDFITFPFDVGFELAIGVMVAPLFVLSVAGSGTAGGFRRLPGVGGADLRWVVPDCVFELVLRDTVDGVAGRLL